ncbi:sugar ABC transporter ATP-binding protein [Lutibacter sp. B2]|nr:sugar ABC transporter ATP-binding protein [Lutibacter sp. B2]
MNKKILTLKNITKNYPGVVALRDVNLEFEKGKVHAIVGENGAGKSTLIKIITGAIDKTSGEMYFKGEKVENNNPIISIEKGINAVYQEFNLIPALTISENIFYGYELVNGIVLDKKHMYEESEKLLEELGVKLSPNTIIKNIGIGNQQIVEIAKALVKKVEVLILDEPTASLTNSEIKNLFKIIEKLRKEGVAIIYISHRLHEVFEISDIITVFRDGELIMKKDTIEFNEDELVNLMVGRDLDKHFIKNVDSRNVENKKVLELKNICTKYINDVSFDLKKGEILGIAGLVSSGRTEIANALFGVDEIYQGHIFVNNKKARIKSPRDAMDKGIAFITEDRKNLGLILEMPIKQNTSYASLSKWSNAGIIDKVKEEKDVLDMLSNLKVRYSSIKEKVKNLSGGNQQKVVISKCLLTDSDIIIFDEPTRGIDIGSKEEVYKIMMELVKLGKSIIMISSEMPEILNMSDRILVMSSGRVVSEYKRGEVTSEQIFKDSASLLKGRDYGKKS